MAGRISIFAVGDVAGFREDPETMFEYSAETLNRGDVLFFQNERHYTKHTVMLPDVSHTEIVPPENAVGLKAVKWDVASFAGNHTMDLGFEALADSTKVLEDMGIEVIGVGQNIAQARRPAIVERKGIKVGFLAYASVIRRAYAAGTDKPGVAPMRAWTVYEPTIPGNPGGEAEPLTFPDRADLAALLDDVRKLRPQVDVLALSMHWGLVRQPVTLAEYQVEVGHAAIDAGVDIILGHHPHILKGVEVYKGKAIFHSMGHFAFDCSKKVRDDWAAARPEENWFRKKSHRFGANIEPAWLNSKFCYPQEHRKTLIVKCIASKAGIERVSFLPAMINLNAQPVVVKRTDPDFKGVMDYIAEISKLAGLNAKLVADGDEVVVTG